MKTVASVMADLNEKGTEKTRKTYVRHGLPADRVLGVLVADLKVVAKPLKGEQALACELYKTGIVEAMYLAGMVANGAKMSGELLQSWAEEAHGLPLIAECPVPWVTVENPEARALAVKWMSEKKPASSGWCAYSGLLATQPDAKLDLAEIEALLNRVPAEINAAPNRVRANMNSFVISTGAYVTPLLKQAKAVARKLGTVAVDVGDTDCKISVALAAIEKIEKAGKQGVKKKTIRC